MLHYGGTQRVLWSEGKDLTALGHNVVYLAGKGSECPFAEVRIYDPSLPLNNQIPPDVDVIHSHVLLNTPITEKPVMFTIHGNGKPNETFDINAVFVSRNHAERHGSNQFVPNGLDFNLLGKVNLSTPRQHLLFLGKASRREKNLRGCIKLARRADKKLAVIGGRGFDIWGRTKYYGMIGGHKKNEVLQKTDALLFPVRWHEPQGLAILESLYFGCPVFGTTYGSLPEIVHDEVGFLSNSYSELVEAIKNSGEFDRKKCHEYIVEKFNSMRMTKKYISLFEKIIAGKTLNTQLPKALIQKKQELLPILD